MSTHSPTRPSRIPLALGLGLALVTILPVPAQAQLGGLIRKAKQAVQKPANADSSNGVQAEEFTEESIASLLKGLQAASARASERDAFRAQQETKQTRLSALLEQHDSDKNRFDDATRKVQDCQVAFLDKREEERGGKTQAAGMALMSDPAKRQKYIEISTKYSQQMQAAQAKGDTAAANAIARKQNDEMMALMGIDMHADTVAAVKTCGAAPAKPGWLVEEETLRTEIDKLAGQIRDAEVSMDQDGTKESGMTPAKYMAARERVLQWMNASKDGNRPPGFSPNEHKLLSSHRGDFDKVKNAL